MEQLHKKTGYFCLLFALFDRMCCAPFCTAALPYSYRRQTDYAKASGKALAKASILVL